MSFDGWLLPEEDERAVALVKAIRAGDGDALRRLLAAEPRLARVTVVATAAGRAGGRSVLHVLTDWPGPAVHGPELVRLLVDSGAEVDATFVGGHSETALHWAASCDDVAVLDALIDAGADLEAGGGVIANGTPLADAVAFGQWRAARRLVERGAAPNLWQSAALGLLERTMEHLAAGARHEEVTNAFWCACHGGQRSTAEALLAAGADRHGVGHDGLTPLEAARRAGADDVVEWLSGLPS